MCHDHICAAPKHPAGPPHEQLVPEGTPCPQVHRLYYELGRRCVLCCALRCIRSGIRSRAVRRRGCCEQQLACRSGVLCHHARWSALLPPHLPGASLLLPPSLRRFVSGGEEPLQDEDPLVGIWLQWLHCTLAELMPIWLVPCGASCCSCCLCACAAAGPPAGSSICQAGTLCLPSTPLPSLLKPL